MKHLAVLFITSLLIFSCEKNEDEPTLPPKGSMEVNLNAFTQTKSAQLVETKVNYTYSAFTVGICNTVIFANMAVPVASFKAAFRKVPTKIADKTWQWQYNFETLGATYTARLTGAIKSDSLEWNMYISKAGIGAFGEFKWYSGKSATDRTGGYWVLNHSQTFPNKYLRIDWEHSNNTIGNIKYTVVRELNNNGMPEKNKGAFVTYGLTDNDLNAFYDIYIYNEEAKDFIDIDIKWSTTTYNGSVMSPQFFKDTNWHCWNSDGIDDDCN